MDTTPIPATNSSPSPFVASLPQGNLTRRWTNVQGPTRPFTPFMMVLPASPWTLSLARRLLDLTVAAAALTVFAIPMFLIALLVRLTSPGPALFTQLRMGRSNRLFRIYKFRSMAVPTPGAHGPGLTRDGDTRITPLGKWLRRLKLDELPQFINILRGEMSLVGPRPKLPKYVGLPNMPYRPGITGAATLYFRNEEEMLRTVSRENLDSFYAQYIRPVKSQLDADYMARATFLSDIKLIACTFLACLQPERVPRVQLAHLAQSTGPAQQAFEAVN